MEQKFAILSLNLYEKDNNWGSVLQSYALQKVLNTLKVDNEILDYKPDILNKNYARFPYKIYSLKSLIKPRNFFGFFFRWLSRKDFIERDNKFQVWMKEHYRISNKKYSSSNADLLKYQGYIVGSDIVWHIPFWRGFEDGYFCNYPSMRNSKNISYAPSMGDKKMSEENLAILKERLKNFSSISIREQSNLEMVQSCTDKNVQVVLDPTLLLPYEEYLPLTKKERIVKEKFIFLYVVNFDKKLFKYVKNVAKHKKLKIVYVSCCPTPNIYLHGCSVLNDVGVDEWLSLIRDAELIFTNSFHCCIFSMIYQKKFFSTLRGEFGSGKIIDLLTLVNLQNRFANSNNITFQLDEEIDYNYVHQQIAKKRIQSLEFLKNALL